MKLTEEQLEQYSFKKISENFYQCWINSMIFNYYPFSDELDLGMEEGNGSHSISNFEEFVTLYNIF